jgi:hypothetical protein
MGTCIWEIDVTDSCELDRDAQLVSGSTAISAPRKHKSGSRSSCTKMRPTPANLTMV